MPCDQRNCQFVVESHEFHFVSSRKLDEFRGFPAFLSCFTRKIFIVPNFEQISKEKPICILLHVFDIIPYDVTCWLLVPADLLLKKAVPLFA